jgi:hypothetical protein
MVANMHETLVWTSVTAGFEDCLMDWVLSLRNTALYDGPALVLNYGAETSVVDLVKRCGVEVQDIELEEKRISASLIERIAELGETNAHRDLYASRSISVPMLQKDCVVNYRYIDILPHLAALPPGTGVAHFDVDMWFQRSLEGLFLEIDTAPGCLFANEIHDRTADDYVRKCITRVTPLILNDDVEAIIAKFNSNVAVQGGHINGGFVAGRNSSVSSKLSGFKEKLDSENWPNVRGANQLYLNYAFDPDVDMPNRNIYNTMPFMGDENVTFVANQWRYGGEIACAIHTMDFKIMNYKMNHFAAFWKAMRQACGCNARCPAG